MELRTDPLCPACEEKETSYHVLGNCYAYMVSRYSIMGAHTMEPEELGNVTAFFCVPSCVANFVEKQITK